MRMRSPRAYSSPSNSSKSQPLATTRTAVPGGASAAASSAIAGVTALTAATRRSAARAMRRLDRALGAHAAPLVAPVRVGEPRVAEVGHERHARAPRDRGCDDVHRVRRRGREHDVDLALAHDPAARRAPRRRTTRPRGRAAARGGRAAQPARPARARRGPRPGARPASPRARARGSARGARSVAGGMSAARPGSRALHFGSSGASTSTSTPSSGR